MAIEESAFYIFDPNSELYQSDSIFQTNNDGVGDLNYNMSVPLEDLSILVELKTRQKGRTILIRGDNTNSLTSKNERGFSVNFIRGLDDKTTGADENNRQPYLTTDFTNLNSDLDIHYEAFGITKIDIEFNSSYAPMITIDFIDVRGASLFNNEGETDYKAFFSFPYPLFELKVKGYYGKPVTYCLHMTKFVSRFNSETGNFEITANYVGYTYALFADVIIGYLRAAGATPQGADFLKSRNTPPLNEVLRKVLEVDKTINEGLKNLSATESSASSLYITNDQLPKLQTLQTNIENKIKELNNSTTLSPLNSSNTTIVVFKNTNTADATTGVKTTMQSVLDEIKKFRDENLPIIRDHNSKVNTQEVSETSIGFSEGTDVFYLTTKISAIKNCNGSQEIPTETPQNEITSTPSPPTFPLIITSAYTVTGNFTSICDELHAFQGTGGNVVGNMNVLVTNKLRELYNAGYPVQVTDVNFTVNQNTVTWNVKIEQTANNINWIGFTSRGAGCNNNIQTRWDSEAEGNGINSIKDNIENPQKANLGKVGSIELIVAREYNDGGNFGPNSFKQGFYRYTLVDSEKPPIVNNNNNQENQIITNKVTAADCKDLQLIVKGNYQSFIQGDNTTAINNRIQDFREALKNINSSDEYVDIVDFSIIMEETSRVIQSTKAQSNLSAKQVANSIADTIETKVGFATTIRNVTKLFTTHIECFMQQLFDVSAKYKDKSRIEQLKRFVSEGENDNKTQKLSDIIKKDSGQNVETIIYPWPEYIEKNIENGSMEEKYLGAKGILSNPSDVPEIAFVEELYKRMLEQAKEEEDILNQPEIQQNTINATPSWFSTNPLDSPYYIETKPYDRLPDNATPRDVARLINLRAIALFATNKYITQQEANNFGKIQGTEIIQKYSPSSNIVSTLNTYGKAGATYANTTGFVNGFPAYPNDPEANRTILIDDVDTTKYKYNYLLLACTINQVTTNNGAIIPIHGPFTKTNGVDRDTTGRVLSSHFGCGGGNTDINFVIKFISKEDFAAKQYAGSLNPFKYSELEKPITSSEGINTAGFLLFSGKYGVQQFEVIDYDSYKGETIGLLPYFTLFFENSYEEYFSSMGADNAIGNYQKSLLSKDRTFVRVWDMKTPDNKYNNILAKKLSRGFQGAFDNEDKMTMWRALYYSEDIYKNRQNQEGKFEEGKRTKFLGKNIQAFRNAINVNPDGSFNIDKDAVSYPFFDFYVGQNFGYNGGVHSLFGSKFYLSQNNIYSKALLFLHCFPWRGITQNKPTIKEYGVFNQNLIQNTLKYRSGFVQVPALWPAFIGSLLWRYEHAGEDKTTNTIFKTELDIGYGDMTTFKPKDPIQWTDKNGYSLIYPLRKIAGGVPKAVFNTKIFQAYPFPFQYLRFVTTDRLISGGFSETVNGTDTPAYSMCFPNYEDNTLLGKTIYLDIEEELLFLNRVTKQAFINEFLDFARTKFAQIEFNLRLDIKNSTGDYLKDWDTTYENIIAKTTQDTGYDFGNGNTNSRGRNVVNTKIFDDNYKTNSLSETPNQNPSDAGYKVFAYDFDSDDYNETDVELTKIGVSKNYNYFFEYAHGSTMEKTIKDLFFDYKYMANFSPNQFLYTKAYTKDSKGLKIYDESVINNFYPKISKEIYQSYIDGLYEVINSNAPASVTTGKSVLLDTSNDDNIKLEIYRHCKKLYDKWVADTDSTNNILFQCCSNNVNKSEPDRLSSDSQVATKYHPETKNELHLIDSFRFVDRSFRDIGDKLYINPMILAEILKDNTNISFYTLLGKILTDNNMDFIALPNFIDYNNKNSQKEIFKPYPYYLAKDIAETGPSFVCMYVGQTSTKLDFGKESAYPNDGFDFDESCKDCPEDFKRDKEAFEDKGIAFVVKYGHQNQNFFKNIILDQAEFGETAETLIITDQIANSKSATDRTYVGQNLFNVYSQRSYKVEVEMLGDAMIQPMMYFQLNNIPMFHGAYLITKVKHVITPNHMLTNFTGTRIKRSLTPLIDRETLYRALLDKYDIPAPAQGTKVATGVKNFAGLPITGKEIGDIANQIKVPIKDAGAAGYCDMPRKFTDKEPEYIVLHWTAGAKFDGCATAWKGYHFRIEEKEGAIMKCADLDYTTNHAGCLQDSGKKNSAGKTIWVDKGEPCKQMNSKSIGISYIGGVEKKGSGGGYVRTWEDWQNTNLNLGNGTYNAKGQWEGIIGAILLAKKHHPSIVALTSHHWISKNKSDVGTEFPWKRLLDEIEARSGWRPVIVDKFFDDYDKNEGAEIVKSRLNTTEFNQGDIVDVYKVPSYLSASETEGQIGREGEYDVSKKNYTNQPVIFEKLMKGFSLSDGTKVEGLNNKELVAGIMANMTVESGFRNDARGDGEAERQKDPRALKSTNGTKYCSWGLTQCNVCGGTGISYLKKYGLENATEDKKIEVLTDADKHLKFVIDETKSLFKNWQSPETPEYWTKKFAVKYERCDLCKSETDISVIKRVNYVQSIITQNYYCAPNCPKAEVFNTKSKCTNSSDYWCDPWSGYKLDTFKIEDYTDEPGGRFRGTVGDMYGLGNTFGKSQRDKYYQYKKDAAVKWAVTDVSANSLIAGNGETDSYGGASMPKMIVAAAALYYNNGVLPSEKAYGNLIAMIVSSSNDCWSYMQALCGDEKADLVNLHASKDAAKIKKMAEKAGPKVNEFVRSKGYSGGIFGDYKPSRYGGNTMTSFGFNRVVRAIIYKEFPGAETLYKVMHGGRTSAGRAQKYIPKNIFLGGKTGTYAATIGEGGYLVYNGKNYAITVTALGKGSESSEIVAIMWGGIYHEYIAKDINSI